MFGWEWKGCDAGWKAFVGEEKGVDPRLPRRLLACECRQVRNRSSARVCLLVTDATFAAVVSGAIVEGWMDRVKCELRETRNGEACNLQVSNRSKSSMV